MAKIEIVGLLEHLDSTLQFLQQLGVVQIIDIPTIEEGDKTSLHRIHLDEKKEYLLERYDELLVNVLEILDALSDEPVEEKSLDGEERARLRSMGPDDLIEHIAGITKNVRRLSRRRSNLLQDLESTRQYETLINTFMPMLEKAEGTGDLEQIGLILRKGESSILPIMKSRVQEITAHESRLFHQRMPDGRIGVFLLIDHADLGAVREMLGNEGVSEYHIPREFRRSNLAESIEALHRRTEEIPNELAALDEQILDTKRSNIALVRFIRTLATNRANQLRILSRLVRTHYTFVISGWTPLAELEGLKENIAEEFSDTVYVGRVKMSDLDFQTIPTLVTNRGIIKPFQLLMKLLPPPKYGTMDATPFITLFFPVFFGIILGDMGYGFVLMAIAGLLKWKASKGSIVSDAGTVAFMAGLSTVFFGFIFGEFFGDLGLRMGLHPLAPWLHRETAIEAILIIALLLGTLHIVLGFGLKTYLAGRSGHTKGVVEGAAKICVVLGVIIGLAQMFTGIPVIIRHVSFGAAAVGLVGIIATEGFIGVLEIFSYFGNILSYSRIMAIGLSSVMLAVVANRLASAADNIVAAILIGLAIHMVNFIMGVFSPTIHSLRLHYVEFFGKFFLPQGRPFQPFKTIGEDHP